MTLLDDDMDNYIDGHTNMVVLFCKCQRCCLQFWPIGWQYEVLFYTHFQLLKVLRSVVLLFRHRFYSNEYPYIYIFIYLLNTIYREYTLYTIYIWYTAVLTDTRAYGT